MTREIPAEAIERFRRLEHRAMTASAASRAYDEKIQDLRDQERDLLTSVQHAYRRAGEGRLEFAADGRVDLVEREVETHRRDSDGRTHVQTTGGRTHVLSAKDPNAAALVRTRKALADAIQRRDAAAEAAKPLVGLKSACAEHLKSLGWREV